MRCPMCQVKMREVPRRGIMIDVCPECRGVWLDAGELEKLVASSDRWEAEHFRKRDDDDDLDDWDDRQYTSQRPRRRGFLADLFDFD